jgi:hypothetical protein
MGDYSFLVAWDAERGAGVRPELEAKYYIPLFWMAMFDPADIRSTHDGAMFARPPNATDKFEDTTYAYCDGALALQRLAARLPALGAATSESLAKRFGKFAQVYAARPVMLRMSSLVQQPIQLQRTRESFAEVASPNTSPERVREIAGLKEGWEAQPYADNILVGWGSELSAREREQTKERAVRSKADRTERERVDAWRAAIDAVSPEQRKRYAASAAFAVGDVVDHVKLGPGVVIRQVDKMKIEVQFEQGTSVLVHKPS